MSSLADANEKLGWAENDLETIYEAVRVFIDSKPYAFFLERRPEPHCYWLKARVQHVGPPDLRRIVSRFGGQARSALDLAVHELASSRKQKIKGFGFPVYAQEAKFLGYRNGKFARTLSSDQWAVVEAAQPYKRGGSTSALWRLHQINNADKHRKIALVAAVGTNAGIRLGGNASVRAMRFVSVNAGEIAKDEAIVADIFLDIEGYMNMQPELSIEVRIGKGGSGQPRYEIHTFLQPIIDEVKQIISDLNMS